jgi:hypothetical protein
MAGRYVRNVYVFHPGSRTNGWTSGRVQQGTLQDVRSAMGQVKKLDDAEALTDPGQSRSIHFVLLGAISSGKRHISAKGRLDLSVCGRLMIARERDQKLSWKSERL